MPIVGSVPSCWGDTTAGKLGITTLLRKGDKVQRCRSIILLNGDLAEISKFVIYHNNKTAYMVLYQSDIFNPGGYVVDLYLSQFIGCLAKIRVDRAVLCFQ
jgi:hypothetical protein